MINRKYLSIVLSMLVIASLLFQVVGQAQITSAAPVAAPASAPTDPQDQSLIPHYFGPWPNYANSPQVLADALVEIGGGGGSGAAAVATVDPRTGSISDITVTSSGSGYLVTPVVTITTAGVVPTVQATAVAELSLGVLTGVTVDESGFGFIAPEVTFDGGGTPSMDASAFVSGYVDNVTIVDAGTDYIHPIVEFDLPDLVGGVQATGVAVVGASGTPFSGTITSIEITNPGTGYSFAPGVTIADAGGLRPSWASGVRRQTAASAKEPKFSTPAVVTASIGVGAVVLVSGGQGYSSAPTVTIADTVAPADKYATATAHVSVLGAVTGISITNPGAGYLTPGLKKFVDPLPGLCDPTGAVAPVCPTAPDAKAIPIAVVDTTTYSGTDYIEIGLVQYRMKFSSLLPETLLRGYVQLETSKNVTWSQHITLTNANLNPLSPTTPILINGLPAYGVTKPSYLGPTIVALKDRPTRILFRNLLPTGTGGDLFLPVDTTLMGAGPGPDMMELDPGGVPLDMAMDEGSVIDEVRNPVCGETPKSRECFSENRATLHLHGGVTPWISDGTPHQWITPAGEDTAYPKGVSVYNVPDMPDPGAGAMTFFYTNQQSARLMFYHDHAWGTTRLNVYAGEAAGYLVTDEAEQNLFVTGTFSDLGLGIPLIVQDKTFVPSAAKMAQQDPTWQADKWGGEGSLWAPHVYMPAQNPGDPSGMSGFGRWMYGPWFWPPSNAEYQPIPNPYYNMDPATDFQTPLAVPCDLDNEATWQYPSDPFCEPAEIPGTPNISVGMEAFNDTPLVNGTVYPTTTVDPKAYRFRVLNAANDRFFNLSWYVADPRTGTLSEVALNPAELAAAQLDPVVFPTPDETWSPKGPNWIQIGTEGGFLPAPVVIPAQPTTWVTDPTRFDVGNVDQHSLLLAPAERADVIVDFSQFRGKTLILYNDAPAAFPARVPSYDYYTGGPDLSPVGVPTILPGYGPNTRTVMQVKVSMAVPALAFDRPNNTTTDRLALLEAAFAHHADGSGLFESSVDPIVVGQSVYNSAYGSNFVTGGWCNSLTTPSTKCDGYARIMEQGGFPFKFDTLGAAKNGTGPQLSIPLQPKGIHDEMNSSHFDEFGRMTANIGLEAPGATPLLQNIILYPYVNPSTEILDGTRMPSALNVTPILTGTDGTQIWKITHNGVDTHPIHFHLFNVQVLNRVAWDNNVIPPDPNELGWKETVRINPLQDTIVVMRPILPSLPFAVPDSYRPLNPMMPIGARGNQNGALGIQAGFNNTDANGNPIAPIVNDLVNFGWEYVWHCHILSHEEMDMMRPMSAIAPSQVPLTPTLVSLVASAPISSTPQVRVTWTDPTPATSPTTLGNQRNEIGFRIERATGTSASAPFIVVATAPANSTVYTDTTVGSATGYRYRVVAFNVSGGATSNIRTITTSAGPKPAAPTVLTAVQQLLTSIRLTFTDNATNETGFVVERGVNGGASTPLTTLARRTGTGSVTYNNITVTVGNTYAYIVKAVNGMWSSSYSNVATVDMLPLAPTSLQSPIQTSTTISLTWQRSQPGATGLGYDVWQGRAPAIGPVVWTQIEAVGDVGAYLVQNLTPDSTYYYQVRAFIYNPPTNTKYYYSTWSNTINANTLP
ncbi:MAG: multicopper oxidase domain-containing protein [Thermoflexales bacterium]|nr:multicopper oxidase domain-containing protein [Thermoflexales bacterium]